MSKIALSFGTPAHGWLSVVLSCEDREQSLDASDVPLDSLRMLAAGLLNLVTGWEQETAVTWCLEPAEVTWHFRRRDHDYELSVQGPERGARLQVFAVGTVQEICAPIW